LSPEYEVQESADRIGSVDRIPEGKWKMANCILESASAPYEGRWLMRIADPFTTLPLKNISKKKYPHRDLSTALPRISCGDPWL
jgi:hypothetical protein